MISLFKVLLLGIIEGITEWLPVSSTGHMLLFDEFIPFEASAAFKELFFIVIQLGAIMAVVVLFWHRLWPFRRPGTKGGTPVRADVMTMWGKVVFACVPGGIATVLLDDYVDAHLHTPVVIAAALIVYGLGFLLIERANQARKPRYETVADMPWSVALGIGLFQVLSLIPGTSRSGSTILGGLILGVSRVAAAEFTFFLAVPAMLGYSLIKLVKFGLHFTAGELGLLLFGMAVAFSVSLACIRFLMNYVKRHDFRVFGWYRIALGALVLLWFLVIK